MKRRTFIKNSTAAGAVIFFVPAPLFNAHKKSVSSDLEEVFLNPSFSARPKTWWHWMNGNITADGITRDLEAMKKAGVGGFQIFQAGTGITKGPVDYGSTEHVELLKHAAREADRLGLEFDMHNCPGWSSSGGPWITPELSMQVLTWSETTVNGGRRVNVKLPEPASSHNYYRDALILAFPAQPGEGGTLESLTSGITTNEGKADGSLLNGGSGIELHPSGEDQTAFIQLEFADPYEARSVLIKSVQLDQPEGEAGMPMFGRGGISLSLEVSDDGQNFRKVCDVSGSSGDRIVIPSTVNFPATKAKYFRLVTTMAVRIEDLRLSGAGRLVDWAQKANFGGRRGGMGFMMGGPVISPEPPAGAAVDPDTVIDVTRYVNNEGALDWSAPEGTWTILRIGHTTTGAQNSPAPDGGSGLECDKFNPEAIEFHLNQFFGQLYETMEPLREKGMAGAVIDSYEVGMQNWTANFPEEFRQRCGYDLMKYMPAMTGRVTGNVDISERFLWDVRRVQADIMADYYYGRFAGVLHEHGMTAYAEPYSGGPFDEMQIGTRMDIPMGEYPYAGGGGFDRQVKLAASCAHLYGKPIVGAESFTGVPSRTSWQAYPFSMKGQGDWMFTKGLNQFIFHRFAHQPHPSALPGMTMGPWGFCFEWTNTWWYPGKAWLDYSARCHSLLQQGTFVADLLYCTSEDAPTSTPATSALKPALPQGYDYDTVNQETILKHLQVENGRIVLPGGMSYSVLVLQDGNTMTLDMLRRIHDLVEQGMCIVGPKPDRTPNLAGYPESENELRRLAGEIWGNADGVAVKENTFGKGRVFRGMTLQEVLDELNIKPDFEFTGMSVDAPVNFIHRRAGDAEVYFVANRRRKPEEIVCTFRVNGMEPELWNADTGAIAPTPVYEISDGRTRIPLQLDPAGSIFVIFRNPAPDRQLHAIQKDGQAVLSTSLFPVAEPGLYKDVTDDFTITVWVKPEIIINLAQQGAPAQASGPGSGTGYVFYPVAGAQVYGEGHAACGLMAGRNGVALVERTTGDPMCVISSDLPLAGWSHIAVAYRSGKPSLYLNGALIGQADPSGKTVHPGIGESYFNDGGGDIYFIGHMGEPELIREALDENGIRQLAGSPLPEPVQTPVLQASTGTEPGLIFWQNGSYSLLGNSGSSSLVNISDIGQPVDVTGPWRLTFPPNLGAPAEITLPELISLRRHPEDGVKYFSGTVSYLKDINIDRRLLENNKRLYLDLGWVEVIAEVFLNGNDLGILWKPPYRMDITDAVNSGNNSLEIRVTDLWLNRLIGDEHLPVENEYEPYGGGFGSMGDFGSAIKKLPDWYLEGKPKPEGGRITFTTWRHYTKDSPLVESGLIGPVVLRSAVLRALS